MGMFFLSDLNNPSNTTFPPVVKDRICVDFTCKGHKCLADGCNLMHPCHPKDMAKDYVETIVKHSKATKGGWLSSFHFANLGLSPEGKSLFSGNGGIASKPC